MLVENLLVLFGIIYTWSFFTVQDAINLGILRDHAAEFVEQWIAVLNPGKSRNYYHWLAVECYREIEKHGSVWKFASDITESFVCVLKRYFLNFTSRGGGKYANAWTEQALNRICIKSLIRSFHGNDIKNLVSNYEFKQLIKEFVRNMMRET